MERKPILDDIEERYRQLLGLSVDELDGLKVPQRKTRRTLRDVLIFLTWKKSSWKLDLIGERFGVSYTAVSHARKRGETELERNAKLRRKLKPLVDN